MKKAVNDGASPGPLAVRQLTRLGWLPVVAMFLRNDQVILP